MEEQGLLDLVIKWFLKPLCEGMLSFINDTILGNTFYNVFFIEKTIGIPDSTLSSMNNVILSFSLLLLTLKVLYKIFNIYILGVDGDNTVSPIEYIKSYAKGIVIVVSFTIIYSWFGDVISDFMNNMEQSITSTGFDSLFASTDGFLMFFKNNALLSITFFLYLCIAIAFYINTIITGIRMMFLRASIPLSCVGIIDNDNGIYSIFIKKIIQTGVTIVAQLCLMRISLIPIQVAPNIFSLIVGIGILIYSLMISQDLNEIFLASPMSGSGQKVSAIGRGIGSVVSAVSKGGK
ncbi:MAG: DUF6102 family protein [Oscillospiraceae bacterium]